jgi:hypothetical protein
VETGLSATGYDRGAAAKDERAQGYPDWLATIAAWFEGDDHAVTGPCVHR